MIFPPNLTELIHYVMFMCKYILKFDCTSAICWTVSVSVVTSLVIFVVTALDGLTPPLCQNTRVSICPPAQEPSAASQRRLTAPPPFWARPPGPQRGARPSQDGGRPRRPPRMRPRVPAAAAPCRKCRCRRAAMAAGGQRGGPAGLAASRRRGAG